MSEFVAIAKKKNTPPSQAIKNGDHTGLVKIGGSRTTKNGLRRFQVASCFKANPTPAHLSTAPRRLSNRSLAAFLPYNPIPTQPIAILAHLSQPFLALCIFLARNARQCSPGHGLTARLNLNLKRHAHLAHQISRPSARAELFEELHS